MAIREMAIREMARGLSAVVLGTALSGQAEAQEVRTDIDLDFWSFVVGDGNYNRGTLSPAVNVGVVLGNTENGGAKPILAVEARYDPLKEDKGPINENTYLVGGRVGVVVPGLIGEGQVGLFGLTGIRECVRGCHDDLKSGDSGKIHNFGLYLADGAEFGYKELPHAGGNFSLGYMGDLDKNHGVSLRFGIL
jgi:hypothetical protein